MKRQIYWNENCNYPMRSLLSQKIIRYRNVFKLLSDREMRFNDTQHERQMENNLAIFLSRSIYSDLTHFSDTNRSHKLSIAVDNEQQ